MNSLIDWFDGILRENVKHQGTPYEFIVSDESRCPINMLEFIISEKKMQIVIVGFDNDGWIPTSIQLCCLNFVHLSFIVGISMISLFWFLMFNAMKKSH